MKTFINKIAKIFILVGAIGFFVPLVLGYPENAKSVFSMVLFILGCYAYVGEDWINALIEVK